MHGPGDPGRIALVSPLQQAQHGVLQPAAGGQHRQAGGLVEHHQITVVEHHRPHRRHGLLEPGGTMPGEPVARRQRRIQTQDLTVARDLPRHQPTAPDRRIGMAMALGVEGADTEAGLGGRHPIAIGPAAVEGRRQPILGRHRHAVAAVRGRPAGRTGRGSHGPPVGGRFPPARSSARCRWPAPGRRAGTGARAFTPPGRVRGHNAPVRCGWRCRS